MKKKTIQKFLLFILVIVGIGLYIYFNQLKTINLCNMDDIKYELSLNFKEIVNIIKVNKVDENTCDVRFRYENNTENTIRINYVPNTKLQKILQIHEPGTGLTV